MKSPALLITPVPAMDYRIDINAFAAKQCLHFLQWLSSHYAHFKEYKLHRFYAFVQLRFLG
jgi:hypothetical protein